MEHEFHHEFLYFLNDYENELEERLPKRNVPPMTLDVSSGPREQINPSIGHWKTTMSSGPSARGSIEDGDPTQPMGTCSMWKNPSRWMVSRQIKRATIILKFCGKYDWEASRSQPDEYSTWRLRLFPA
ncbi:hypothetical protein FQA39_LY08605 [Lamprigera yunnana]|nr:hypothetical protein FQA39_LY08605 [Lamprigera yunnana]